MEKIRICHMADFHLGSKLDGTSELNKKINRDILKSLNEIVKMLNTSKVDLALIARRLL